MKYYDLIVVGGGAAGFFMAIHTKANNPALKVAIIEGTSKPLSKILVSGGGRCNVTNELSSPSDLVKNYPRGSKELLSPFYRFGPKDLLTWFQSKGLSFHTEADGRIFPSTNKSSTIFDCLMKQIEHYGIDLLTKERVETIESTDNGFSLWTSQQKITCKFVAFTTGSAPKAKKIIETMGHKIIPATPSLFTFKITDPMLDEMQGISFPWVKAKLKVGKTSFQQEGPLLITHWGLSGPAILKLSAFAALELKEESYQATLKLNFLANSNIDKEIDRLTKYKDLNGKQKVSKLFPYEFPKRFWNNLLGLEKIDPDTPWNQVSKKGIRAIANRLTSAELYVTGKGVFKEEFVTAGGVNLKEVDFKTMESKIVKNLFFGGEVLNIDGVTGGFNFQNAWTTAWIAAQEISSR